MAAVECDLDTGIANLTITAPAATLIEVTVTISFSWGTFTDATGAVAQNPYNYYNGLDYSAANATAAKDALTAIAGLQAASDGAEYIITVSTTVKGGTVAP